MAPGFSIDVLCVFLAFLLIWVPQVYVARSRVAAGGYDKHQPRDQQARLDARGRRAAAAHTNTFEAFAPFAIAVIFARVTHADRTWTNALCAAFVAARAVYPFVYVYDRPALRSAVWCVGLVATGGLFLLAMIA